MIHPEKRRENRQKLEQPKELIRCADCEYSYTVGFVHERLVCEKHPEIEITDDWFCADGWKA